MCHFDIFTPLISLINGKTSSRIFRLKMCLRNLMSSSSRMSSWSIWTVVSGLIFTHVLWLKALPMTAAHLLHLPTWCRIANKIFRNMNSKTCIIPYISCQPWNAPTWSRVSRESSSMPRHTESWKCRIWSEIVLQSMQSQWGNCYSYKVLPTCKSRQL